MNKQKAVLILGLFLDPADAKKNIRTAEDRIAAMFRQNNVEVITSSSANGKTKRFIETLQTLIKKRDQYNIAIIPLFGTWPSFLWQEIVTRLLKLFKKKIILGIHGGSIPGRIEEGARRFYSAMRRADILFAPSFYFGAYLKQKGFDVFVIENPVDLSEYKFCPKKIIRPRIVWMRAFTDIYHPLLAVHVAKKMADHYEDFEMIMAGKDGPLLDAAKDLTKKYGIENKVIFPGYINTKQKQQYAQDYDIYICTNKVDNTPVSLTEFMQLGLPIVAVNTGGIPYMIEHGVNGLLTNTDDAEDMFNKIKMLIDNKELSRSIITNAYNYVQQYDEKNVIHKWKSLLSEIESN